MLKRWALALGLLRSTQKESKSNKDLRVANISLDMSIQFKNSTVRIVHAGGKEELYQHPILASQLMEKYPEMCVAWPNIFKRPHESILSAEDYLLPGQKYYLVPSTTVEKLKRRRSRKGKVKQLEGSQQPILFIKDVADVGAENSDESICSAKDFYVSSDRWSSCLLRRTCKEKKPFIPPIQKPKTWKELEWEPSLTSIEEVSP
ncbi:hypothetical protein ACH5RR_030739 [Cinchona calisaya]|uniref:Uncharacterized protein n=1 Tax=Cinchona calisaya TaxID=153742 RepID=A0ABD2Z0M1_9GENT